MMQKPEVQSSVFSPIPKQLYTARAMRCVQGTAPKGYKRLVIDCEIIAPDVVEDPMTHERYNVAGRRFTLYLPTEVTAGQQYTASYAALTRLQFAGPDGSINPDDVADAVQADNLFFRVVLSSEEDVVRGGDGKALLDPMTNKPISRGHRISFVGADDIIDRQPKIGGGGSNAY